MKTNKYTFRVYYEDTDMAGVVYYANYLRFIERARSDHVREIGIDQLQMKDELGVVFVVRRVEADYVQAARFGDVLEIESWLTELTGVMICSTRASYLLNNSRLCASLALLRAA